MMDYEAVRDLISDLTVMLFFPSEPAARVALIRMVGEMAENEDQVRWLVQRMTSGLYNEWPGPGELRAVFCSRFRPRDGLTAYSSVYPDGIPSERPAAPPLLALPPGHVASIDPELEHAVREVAAAKDLNRPRLIRGPSIPVDLDFKPVTQADIDRAIEEYHGELLEKLKQRAQQELHGDAV